MNIAVGGIEVCRGCTKRLKPISGRPAYVRSNWPVSRERVFKLRSKGLKIRELASEFKITERHVLRILSSGYPKGGRA